MYYIFAFFCIRVFSSFFAFYAFFNCKGLFVYFFMFVGYVIVFINLLAQFFIYNINYGQTLFKGR